MKSPSLKGRGYFGVFYIAVKYGVRSKV